MPNIATAKLSIPRDLMDYWHHWRKENGYIPQVSHIALYIYTRMDFEARARASEMYRSDFEDLAVSDDQPSIALPEFSPKLLSGLPSLYGAWYKCAARFSCDGWNDIVVYTSPRGAYDAASQSRRSQSNREKGSRGWGEILVVKLEPRALFGMTDRTDTPDVVGRIGRDGREQHLVKMG